MAPPMGVGNILLMGANIIRRRRPRSKVITTKGRRRTILVADTLNMGVTGVMGVIEVMTAQ